MDPVARLIAQRLLEVKAIQLKPGKPFTWASGRKAPIYCDNRILLSYPEIREELLDAFIRKTELVSAFGQVAGVATAGIPHGAILAQALKLPFLYVRSKPKDHGRQNQIEGRIEPGEPVLVIEDLISTGGSSLKAVSALQEEGAKVAGVMAIFTYGFPDAAEAFEAAYCPYFTLTDYETLLQVAKDLDYIREEDLETLEEWSKDPVEWSKQA